MGLRVFRGLAAIALAALAVALVARNPVSVSEAKLPPAGVVDSAVPREEALRRFRLEIPPVDSLTGGAASMDALVREFAGALETRDTATFRRLVLDLREFAWLYYDTNPQSLPPYDLSPSLFWFLLERGSRGGVIHLLEERGGQPLGYVRTRCEGRPSREGRNTVYGPCLIERRDARGAKLSERLFGQIVERGGRWKFVSFANKLD